MNAVLAVSSAMYANTTGTLGVPSEFSDACTSNISDTLVSKGILPTPASFCGLGIKIQVSYQCVGMTTILEMLQSPNFNDVTRSCATTLSDDVTCKSEHLRTSPAGLLAPDISPSPLTVQVPAVPPKHHRSYKLVLFPAIEAFVTGLAVILVIVLILLIRRKSKELEKIEGNAWSFSCVKKGQEGSDLWLRGLHVIRERSQNESCRLVAYDKHDRENIRPVFWSIWYTRVEAPAV